MFPGIQMEKEKLLYRCLSCGQVFAPDMLSTREMRCPYCGYRVIKKLRTGFVKVVKSE